MFYDPNVPVFNFKNICITYGFGKGNFLRYIQMEKIQINYFNKLLLFLFMTRII